MKTRMQPILNVWSLFPRTVRDLAVACGKQVRLELEGQDTELDRTIIEAIRDPLTHLVRNSVDHGIELPEARVAAGKPEQGRLLLRAFHEGGRVNIEMIDDGAGIDLERVRRQLTLAGHSQPADVDRFLVVRLLTVVAIPVLWLVVALDTSFHGVSLVALFVLIGLALVLGPESWLQQSVVARQSAIRRRLPDILDLRTISVEAGLGFEQALARTVASVPGPLSDEFARALGELRAGASRVEAFMAVVARTEVPELRTFILALIQAEEFGISVGSILRAQADEMRVRRRQYAEERAHKAPVKMLVPMAFCILPAMFVVVIGPAAISIIHALSHVGAV